MIKEKSGCGFYECPSELDLRTVDPLMAEPIRLLNATGWVWTAESCQGHPDSEVGRAWASNNSPMLRLVTREHNVGKLLKLLFMANKMVTEKTSRFEEVLPEETNICGAVALKVYPCEAPEGWCEMIVFVPADNVFYRNVGIRVFEKFGHLCCKANEVGYVSGIEDRYTPRGAEDSCIPLLDRQDRIIPDEVFDRVKGVEKPDGDLNLSVLDMG